MFSTVLSAALDGLKVELIHVEADVSNGLPALHMVGYLSSEVREASERVKTALVNSGFSVPPKKIIINLAPATVKKRGPSFDLPIALALLEAFSYIDEGRLNQHLVIGELGLSGEVLQVSGVLPIILEAKKAGVKTCLIPRSNLLEGMMVEGVAVVGVTSIEDVFSYLDAPEDFLRLQREEVTRMKNDSEVVEDILDFSDIHGQEIIKRAAEIAVAGQHNLLMIGTPGASKTMIAKRIPTILPPMSMEEMMEIAKIYSVSGLLSENAIMQKRPFREVHHTTTKSALLGGGSIPKPGEITLAHGGVLLMDELAEFPANVLEVLRQPLEEQEIKIIRSRGTYIFPADFLLVAATNPCPCGYYPDLEKCTCTLSQIEHYLGKLSGPLLSRIDMCLEAPRVIYEELVSEKKEETSAEIRERVCKARQIQEDRYQEESFCLNGRIPAQKVQMYCSLDAECRTIMEQAYHTLSLTARTYHKVLRVARTIADLDHEKKIKPRHLREALSYRMLDGKQWGKQNGV